MSRIFLDSCIVIYFVEKHVVWASEIEARISTLGSGDILCYSPLTRLECLVKPIRTRDNGLKGLFESFFGVQQVLDIETSVFDDAAHLRADFGSLRTPDALHLATARYHDCDEFWTNDDRLESVAPSLVKNILSR